MIPAFVNLPPLASPVWQQSFVMLLCRGIWIHAWNSLHDISSELEKKTALIQSSSFLEASGDGLGSVDFIAVFGIATVETYIEIGNRW